MFGNLGEMFCSNTVTQNRYKDGTKRSVEIKAPQLYTPRSGNKYSTRKKNVQTVTGKQDLCKVSNTQGKYRTSQDCNERLRISHSFATAFYSATISEKKNIALVNLEIIDHAKLAELPIKIQCNIFPPRLICLSFPAQCPGWRLNLEAKKVALDSSYFENLFSSKKQYAK